MKMQKKLIYRKLSKLDKTKGKIREKQCILFFAGHGLASDDGENVYLLPYDGEPELLEISVLSHEELFSDINEVELKCFCIFDMLFRNNSRQRNPYSQQTYSNESKTAKGSKKLCCFCCCRSIASCKAYGKDATWSV